MVRQQADNNMSLLTTFKDVKGKFGHKIKLTIKKIFCGTPKSGITTLVLSSLQTKKKNASLSLIKPKSRILEDKHDLKHVYFNFAKSLRISQRISASLLWSIQRGIHGF
jgi:hypothetical protein